MWKFLTKSSPSARQIFSPNHLYVACVGAPHEVWGNYTAPIALWEANDPRGLLYHREGYLAHALSPGENPTFVYWSECNNWMFFYEFKRQEVYQLVFIELPQRQVYRLLASDTLLTQLAESRLSNASIMSLLQQEKAVLAKLVLNPVTSDELRIC